MATRNDRKTLHDLLQGSDVSLSNLASDYLSRLRKLADASSGNELLRSNQTALAPIAALLACENLKSDIVSSVSAQKASFIQRAVFAKCLLTARNLLAQASNPVTPQKRSPHKPAKRSLTFESLADGYYVCELSQEVINEMYDVEEVWEMAMMKTSPAKQASGIDPRHTRAIFVWVLSILQYPIDKAAFANAHKMLLPDLDTILGLLNQRCKSKRSTLEKKASLPSHRYAPSSTTPSPSKPLKRKAPDTPSFTETTPTKKQRTPAESTGQRTPARLTVTRPDGLAAEASSPADPSPSRRPARSSPFASQQTTTPTKRPGSTTTTPSHLRSALTTPASTSRTPASARRARFASPESTPEPAADERSPSPEMRRRFSFVDRLGPGHEENVRLVEWFGRWKERVERIGWRVGSSEDEEQEQGEGGEAESVEQAEQGGSEDGEGESEDADGEVDHGDEEMDHEDDEEIEQEVEQEVLLDDDAAAAEET